MLRYISLVCLLASSLALAYEPERARASMAHESAECAAYFMTTSQAPGLDAQAKDRLRSDAGSLVELSAKLTSETLARKRTHMASRAMLRELDGDWTKVSMLDNNYKASCKDLIANPKARMQYWIDRRE